MIAVYSEFLNSFAKQFNIFDYFYCLENIFFAGFPAMKKKIRLRVTLCIHVLNIDLVCYRQHYRKLIYIWEKITFATPTVSKFPSIIFFRILAALRDLPRQLI